MKLPSPRCSKWRRKKLRRLIGALDRSDWRCWWCSAPLMPVDLLMRDAGYWRRTEGVRRATIEHLRHRANGGTNAASNLVAACEACNHGRATNPQTLEHSDGVVTALLTADGEVLVRSGTRWVRKDSENAK